MAEILLKGTLVISGKVDVGITIYNGNQESQFSLSKVNIESVGGQLADTKIRGKIVDMMGKTHGGTLFCAQF